MAPRALVSRTGLLVFNRRFGLLEMVLCGMPNGPSRCCGPPAHPPRLAPQPSLPPSLPPSAAAAVFSSLSNLQAAAASGSAADAKRGFVATVTALKGWASDANVAVELKGL